MTAIELAAIASAAVPGLNVTAFGPEPDDTADFCSALLVDSDKRRWRVRSPRHAEASTRLETERQVLRAFPPAIRAELPFLLPTVAGTVRQGELTTFVYSHIAGRAATVERIGCRQHCHGAGDWRGHRRHPRPAAGPCHHLRPAQLHGQRIPPAQAQ